MTWRGGGGGGGGGGVRSYDKISLITKSVLLHCNERGAGKMLHARVAYSYQSLSG